jgi:hypothetical protein
VRSSSISEASATTPTIAIGSHQPRDTPADEPAASSAGGDILLFGSEFWSMPTNASAVWPSRASRVRACASRSTASSRAVSVGVGATTTLRQASGAAASATAWLSAKRVSRALGPRSRGPPATSTKVAAVRGENSSTPSSAPWMIASDAASLSLPTGSAT